MSNTNKFLTVLMGQGDGDFRDVIDQFPENEQEEFINFLVDFLAFMANCLKQLPIALRKDAVLQSLSAMGPDNIREFAWAIGELAPDFEVE